MKAFLRAALAALIALAPLTEAAAAAYRPLVNVAGVTKQIPNAATVQTPAPTTANASLNLPHGTAPSAPVNGDVWTTTAGVFSRINGVTIGPFGAGGGTPGGSSGELQYNNAGAFGGFTAAGDCTFSVPNFTCTKTGGVSFGYFATGTDGANLTGTISVNRFNGGSGASTSTFLRGDGTWVAPTAGVTTTGSPASGNLAKFSGASTITNGDLSGDCTTVGTLAITCLKTNGVAFSGLATASTTNGVTLGNLAQVAANTMLGNWTGSAANIVANAMPGCADSGGNHLNYVAGTGVTCGTSVGAATPAVTPNTQTGTTYTVLSTDNGKFLRFTNSGTIAVTVPQATGSFTTGFTFFACSYSGSSGGGGGVTFTPTTSTVNGLANYKLFYGGCSQWVSDGTNWLVMPMVAFYGGTGGGYSLSYQDTTDRKSVV